MIFDLLDTPVLTLHQPPQGYFAPGSDVQRQMTDSLRITQMVGEFSKPKFFLYKEKLCAHGRNGKVGCTACIDVCSAEAVSHNGDQIKVNPNLCVGCGACTTVCPSGALAYAYPRVADTGTRLKTMLTTYAKAGGTQPALLIHNQEQGATLVNQLGRLARAGDNKTGNKLKGLPANVIPLELHHIASVGIDFWLTAIAYGTTHIAVLVTHQDAPQYVAALNAQIDIAQTVLSGLGYTGVHLSLIQAQTPAELDTGLSTIQPAQVPQQRALFNIAADKRSALELAIDHLKTHAPQQVEQIALPLGAPFGLVTVNKQSCTLSLIHI